MADARPIAAERGCLVVADIAGYTSYLLGVELEHAHDILADLMETVVGALTPTFRLSKLEGDAAFAYAVTESVESSMLLDTIERAYFAFRRRLRDVAQATSCPCSACSTIPSLELKFVVHHGRFVRRAVAGSEELTGRDVVVLHRLLKNRVAATFGLEAYVLVTADCLAVMDLDAATLGLRLHREAYDDVGAFDVFVGDLHDAWARERGRHVLRIDPADAAFEYTSPVLPVPPETAWEYLTSPTARSRWQADRIDVLEGPRRGAGTVNHCVHGGDVTIEQILDWHPFEYYTAAYTVPVVGPWPWTFELEGVDGGTVIHARAQRIGGLKGLPARVLGPMLVRGFAAQQVALADLLEREVGGVSATT